MIMLNFTISLSVIDKSNNKQTQYLALNFIKEKKLIQNTIIHFNELSMRSINCINTNIELLKNGSIKVSVHVVEILLTNLKQKLRSLKNFQIPKFLSTRDLL